MNTFIPSSFSADAIAAQAAQFAANQAAIQGAQAAKEQKQANTANMINSITGAATSIFSAFSKKKQPVQATSIEPITIQPTPTNYVLWAAGGLAAVAVIGTLVYVVTKD